MRVYVAYDSRYGNTKLVADKIIEGMDKVGGMEIINSYVKKVDRKKIVDCDAILIGAPVHFGAPSRTIRGFIDELGKLDLRAKWAAVFDTYLKTDFEKGVKPMEARIAEKLPKLKLIAPGLSIQVTEMKGPITDGELPKCLDFGKKIGIQLKES